jgi:hypothetical protein
MLRRIFGVITLSVSSIFLVTAWVEAKPDRSPLTCTWIATTGDWTTGSNWDCGVGPGDNDTAIINNHGTVNLNTGITSWNLILDGSTITGTSPLMVTGNMTWTSGTMGGEGFTTIATGATLNVIGNYTSTPTLDKRVINNLGALIWTQGVFSLDNGAVVNNYGLFDAQVDAYIRGSQVTCSINNLGVFRKSLGSGTTTIGPAWNWDTPFNNSGTVEVFTGVFGFRNGVIHSGATFAGPGISRIEGGVVTISGTVNTPKLELASGTLTGTGTLTVTDFSWTGGIIDGANTVFIPANGTLTISSSADKGLNRRSLVNKGTISWTGGRIILDQNARIVNAGVFDVQADTYIGGTAIPSGIDNQGVFRKTAGTGVTAIGPSFSWPVPFTNTGEVSVLTGTLSFKGPYIQTGGALVVGGNGLIANTALNLQSGVLAGNGVITGNVNNAGGVVAPGNSPGALTISGNYAQSAAGILQVEISGPTNAQFDRLIVNGNANLSGTLAISLINGFAPEAGNTFGIMDYNSRAGYFSVISSPTWNYGLTFTPVYSTTSLTLQIISQNYLPLILR